MSLLWTGTIGNRLRFGAAIIFGLSPDARRRPVLVQREPHTDFFLVSGFGSGAYSAKLLAGTRQRFPGLSHMRQCGDDVLQLLVTGGPPYAAVAECSNASLPTRARQWCFAARWLGCERCRRSLAK